MYACTFSAKLVLRSFMSTSVSLLDRMILHAKELKTEYNKLTNSILGEASFSMPEQTETVSGRQPKSFAPKYWPAIPICSGSNSRALYPFQGCQDLHARCQSQPNN